MLDRDLAGLYGVPTKVLNQAVKRNAERFLFTFKLPLRSGCDSRFDIIRDRRNEAK